MQKFLNLFISGMVTGAIYSIMASGLVLTYQTSGVFNFAHGAVAFACAYFYFQLNTGQHIPIVPSLILTVVFFAPLLGYLLNRIVLGRLSSAPVYARIVGTIGLLIALPNLVQWLVDAVAVDWLGLNLAKLGDYGGGVGFVPPGVGPTPSHVYRLSWLGLDRVVLNSDQLAVFIVAAIVAGLLYVVIRRTRVGLEMRAQVDRESLAAMRGISPSRTSSDRVDALDDARRPRRCAHRSALPAERQHVPLRRACVDRGGGARGDALDPARVRGRPGPRRPPEPRRRLQDPAAPELPEPALGPRRRGAIPGAAHRPLRHRP